MQRKFMMCYFIFFFKCQRTSDGGNRSHSVSLPIILKKTKVGQILQYSCISLLLVPILLYWVQVSVSLNVLIYFGAEMDTFCIKHIENRKIFFYHCSPGSQQILLQVNVLSYFT